ncbi:hypothetical protein ACI8AC_10255 [Geodermatophilus sp. SYSU D00758]
MGDSVGQEAEQPARDLALLRSLVENRAALIGNADALSAATLLLPFAAEEETPDDWAQRPDGGGACPATELVVRLAGVSADQSIATLLHLWLYGMAGRRESAQALWALSEAVAPTVGALVTRLRDVDAPYPVIRWLGDLEDYREMLEQLATGDRPAGMDRHAEKDVWNREVQPRVAAARRALLAGDQPDFEMPDEEVIAGWANAAADQGGSRRTYFANQATEQLRSVEGAVERQQTVQPWRGSSCDIGTLRESIEALAPDHREIADHVLRYALVRAADWEEEEKRVADALSDRVQRLAAAAVDRDDRFLLAAIAASRPGADGTAAASLDRIRAEVADLRRRCSPLDSDTIGLIEMSLGEYKLTYAEELFAEAEQTRRQREQATVARKRIERLRASSTDAFVVSWRKRAEEALSDGRLPEAEHAVGVAERADGLHRQLAQLEADAGHEDAELLVDLVPAQTADDLDNFEARIDRARQQLEERQAQRLEQRYDELLGRLAGLVEDDYPLLAESRQRREQASPLRVPDVDELADRVRQVEVTRAQKAVSALADIRRLLEESQLGADDRRDASRLLDEVSDDLESGRLVAAHRTVGRARALIERRQVPNWRVDDGEEALVAHLERYVQQFSGIGADDVRRLHVALKAKPFVILAGLTGSGKTAIARLYAEALNATPANGRFVRIAVRPNWVDESDVLGYLNPVSNVFQPGFLALLVRACERDPDLPFFCLLDEMNLAPVEQYMADVLSAMEDVRSPGQPRPALRLYSPGIKPGNAQDWPSELPLPENLFLIGTVNVDETTRALSDRVLDRANVLQLATRVTRAHHEIHPDPGRPDAREPSWAVRWEDWQGICSIEPSDRAHDLLVQIADAFTGMRLGLGLRAHIEVERFLGNASGVLPDADALDLALLQRVVPKVRGYKRDLEYGLEQFRTAIAGDACRRCTTVLDDWLDPRTSDDAFLDGTDVRVGLLGQ